MVKAEFFEWTQPDIIYVSGEHNSVTKENHNLKLRMATQACLGQCTNGFTMVTELVISFIGPETQCYWCIQSWLALGTELLETHLWDTDSKIKSEGFPRIQQVLSAPHIN